MLAKLIAPFLFFPFLLFLVGLYGAGGLEGRPCSTCSHQFSIVAITATESSLKARLLNVCFPEPIQGLTEVDLTTKGGSIQVPE